ncbi:effector binding domain-containing protein [Methanobrevibacter sp. OttesenSCG-928-K11]|nr:effector binding domain-containing protein [Methanobrevibacter sp. OttesenSCG-928-K11]MDL2271354.1 effector binding domain-containing protein [Methanobrevibacter sp. OttesenSCG-928-I08]
MKIDFKNRDSFKLCGYSVETNLDSALEDIGDLCEKYEEKLLKLTDSNLYGVMWYSEGHNYVYAVAIEYEDNFNKENMEFIEIPSAYFAIATVPENMSVIEAWTVYFEKSLPELGYLPDYEHGLFFESYDNNGTCELWTPVKKEE